MRSTRWQQLYDEATPEWRKWLRERLISLPKHIDSSIAYYAYVDLRSIHRSEYREPEDEAIRVALDEAREAVRRLTDLLWARNRRKAKNR
jgi:hypothetical protein